ncbi:oligosaccharide flippase family protein [Bradyrhizobium sp. BWA-3-5]|uniref:oligosaccharide flippase family protein n=1 Tax=Bradyrhizobium sp. BWA-3-5 TaxID=3080013 RepID=UPI00293E1428|nr:oligosaccharide flippase family protein [Bradyrhizobium sp. BWA-3-5]WOH68047.1 oligosaccharide flippase family protein [Bradyrhizobium sp. BWA-3-5]
MSRSANRLGSQATAGAITLVASRLIARGLDLLTLVVLGRLLSPADFGLVAIAMAVVQIFEAVMELPLGLALVALPQRTKLHYDCAFTLQLLRGLALSATLLTLSWPISHIYGDYRLVWLVCALSIAPAARGLLSPRTVEYALNFNYLPSLTIEVAGKLAAFLLSIVVAWLTASYWSIAIATIASPVMMLVVSYCFAPYLPALSLREWRTFSKYLRFTTASQAVAALVWQMDQLMLGRFVDRFELGRFSMASNLAALPTQILIGQTISPLAVAFSSVRGDLERLRAAYHKSAVSIAAIGLPAMVWISINAEPVIRLVLGQKWVSGASILSWLSLAMIPPLLAGPLIPLATTLNKTNVFLRLSSIELFIKTPLMLVGLTYYGIPGVIAVRLMTATAIWGYTLFVIRELIGLRLRDQLLGPRRTVISTAIMAAAIAPLQGRFTDQHNLVQLVVDLTIVGGTAVAAYVVSMFLLWRAAGSPDGAELHVTKLLVNSMQRVRSIRAK